MMNGYRYEWSETNEMQLMFDVRLYFMYIAKNLMATTAIVDRVLVPDSQFLSGPILFPDISNCQNCPLSTAASEIR